MTSSSWRRVAVAIGASAAMVVVLAAFFPRIFLANDDIGLCEYLRKDTFTPWISPILSQGLRSAYRYSPGVPWWGLYQYALIIATGAVLIHTLIEVVDRRPGHGRIATLLGALIIGASHTILVVGITWTTVSISALGTATAAFVTHAQSCHAAGRPVSRLRALIYGLVALGGYMIRIQGFGAMAVALLPFLAWAAWWFLRRRHLPRLTAVLAFIGPLAMVVVLQDRIPREWNDTAEFERWTTERGRIHSHTAFEGLDTRAPELLARAGWSLDEYRDFMNWLIIDERDYPIDKIERLLATGGVPEAITLDWNYRQLRSIYEESTASVALFLTVLIGGVVLALLGMIERTRSIAFCIGYLVFLIAVPLWMAANYRFPQRVSLSFYTVAALGVFLYLARTIADRPAEPEITAASDHRPAIGLAVIALCMFVWARNLIAWIDRDTWPYRVEMQALEDRVTARGGFVFVYVQAGLVELDPLRAEPRGYDGLQGGWGTFSPAWYDTIKQLGVRRGADVFGAMVDNPDTYVLAQQGTREILEDWIRRKIHNPAVRLALVDGADLLGGGRPELYRLVTTPLVRDSDEWRMLARYEWSMLESLPGPPSVSGLRFHPVALYQPYEHYGSTHDPSADIHLESGDGSLRCIVTGATRDGCAVTAENLDAGVGHSGGIHIQVNGLLAARFEVKLLDPQNIVSLNVHANTSTHRSIQWRWLLGVQSQELGFTGAVTLVPGHPARQLGLAVNTAKRRDIRDLHIFIVVTPGMRAGFELRNLEVAEP